MTSTIAAPKSDAAAALALRYGERVDAAARAAIPTDGPQRHLYELVRASLGTRGKRMRPLLCLAACALAGGDPDDAVPAAVAIELLHNAFLIHDDIEDASLVRRGQPALHVTYGLARALNAGDALTALALGQLVAASNRVPATAGRQLITEFAHLLRRTVEGQATELGWIVDERFDVQEADYLAMVRDKTCWYSTIHPLRIGSLLGGMPVDRLDCCNEFGFYLGALFQVHDDLENLLAPRDGYGKDHGGDILEGKRTLMLIHLLSRCDERERRMVQALVGPTATGSPRDRVDAVLAMLHDKGSIDYARRLAGALAGSAFAAFARAFPGPASLADAQLMLQLIGDLDGRSHGLGHGLGHRHRRGPGR